MHLTNSAPYSPPTVLRGGHLQSIVPSLWSRAPWPVWARTRWEWPDGDFVDADGLHVAARNAPLLVLFHGLEGSSASHYARSVGAYFQARGWRVIVPHFRGCSGVPNRLLRAYHSGDADEIGRMLAAAHHDFPEAPLYAAGVSLGGNALLCYAAEQRHAVPLIKIASVCAPLDLGRCGEAITTGFANIYTLMFMRTLLAKTRAKRPRFEQACDWDRVLASKNLLQFDDAFTAPVHGYDDAADYYARASAKPKLGGITLPTLLLNALNDPFVPRDILAHLELSPSTCVDWPLQGGHVGFASGAGVGELSWLPERLFAWFTGAT